MIIYNILNEEELDLLKDINIIINQRDYSDDEIVFIMEQIQDAEVDNMIEGEFSPKEESYAHLYDRFFLITESVYKAVEKAKKSRKEDFVADRIGENDKYLVISMTNSSITDGFDRPLLLVNKQQRKEVLSVPLFDYPNPLKDFEDLELGKLDWKEI